MTEILSTGSREVEPHFNRWAYDELGQKWYNPLIGVSFYSTCDSLSDQDLRSFKREVAEIVDIGFFSSRGDTVNYDANSIHEGKSGLAIFVKDSTGIGEAALQIGGVKKLGVVTAVLNDLGVTPETVKEAIGREVLQYRNGAQLFGLDLQTITV